MAELVRYCRCVAGAVGLLSIPVFGAEPTEPAGALALGEALQLTNILRDLTRTRRAVASICRASCWSSMALRDADPPSVLAHPALPEVCEALAELAEQRFAEAERCFSHGRRALRPALIMMGFTGGFLSA